MNDKKLDELNKFLKGNGIKNGDIASYIGISNATVSQMLNGKAGMSNKFAKGLSQMTGISIGWLLFDDCEMFEKKKHEMEEDEDEDVIKTTAFSDFLRLNGIRKNQIAEFLGVSNAFVTQLANGDRQLPISKLKMIRNRQGWDSSMLVSSITDDLVPIIPAEIVRRQNVDVWQFVNKNIDTIEKMSVLDVFPRCDLFYRVNSDAMRPNIEKGDILALRRIGSADEIVNGECYIVDVYSRGLIIRVVSSSEDSLVCRSNIPGCDDLVISKSDVCNVFAIVGLMRQQISCICNELLLREELGRKNEQIDKMIVNQEKMLEQQQQLISLIASKL